MLVLVLQVLVLAVLVSRMVQRSTAVGCRLFDGGSGGHRDGRGQRHGGLVTTTDFWWTYVGGRFAGGAVGFGGRGARRWRRRKCDRVAAAVTAALHGLS